MAWVQEGLLDRIFLNLPLDPEMAEAIRTAGCKLIIGLPRDPVAGAQEAHKAGADGLWRWDMNYSQQKPQDWEVLKRLGHTEDVDRFAEAAPRMKTIPLKTVAGFDVWHTINNGANERGYWPPEILPVYTGG